MKKVLCFMLATMFIMSLADMAAAEAPKPKLTIIYRDANDLRENDSGYKWIMSVYEKWDKKDEVELELLPQVGSGDNMFTKADLMMQSAATCPDLYIGDSFQAVSDGAAGYLLDLKPYLENWDTWNNGSFYEASKEMVIDDKGAIYGVPCETDARGMWMNKQILAEADLGEDWEPKNWEDLLNGLRQIKERCPDVYPLWYKAVANSEGTTVNNMLLFLMGTQDSLYDWQNSKWNISSQGLWDTLTFYETTAREGLTGPVSEMVNSSADSFGNQYLREGKLAIIIGGSWVANAQFADGAAFEWEGYADILKFVRVPQQFNTGDDFVTVSGGYALLIPALTDIPDLAFDFLTAMMDDVEALTLRNIQNGNLACRNISDAPSYAEYTARPFVQEATEFLEWTKYRPQISTYPTVSAGLSTALEAVITGTDAREAMEDFAYDMVNALDGDNVQFLLN